MTAREYYKKATEKAIEFNSIVEENRLKESIIKLMDGYHNHTTELTEEELNKLDRESLRDELSWGEINGY